MKTKQLSEKAIAVRVDRTLRVRLEAAARKRSARYLRVAVTSLMVRRLRIIGSSTAIGE